MARDSGMGGEGSHESFLHRMLFKSVWMRKGKRSWYSIFANLILSRFSFTQLLRA